MRVLFIVQGEGRGHLTQAISLAQLLRSAGHEIVGAWVNVAGEGAPPPFFTEQFPAPITPVAGPALVYHSVTNALDWKQTLWGVLRRAGRYLRSLRQLRDAIATEKPDVVVNFFELLAGLTYGLYRPRVPMVCVGHQCMAFHADFPFPAGRWFDRLAFQALVRLNAWGASELFGLSFDEQPDEPRHRLRVMPPLLRRETTHPSLNGYQGPYLLAYTTQPGLISEVLKAHRQRPDMLIRYFNARATEPEEWVDATLRFCQLDGQRYLHAMQHCRALMTTAGFESVCEALYLSKPVLMMPQPNHYEQACNALDGQRAGAGIASDRFDPDRLMNYLSFYDTRVSQRFRDWQATGQIKFVAALQRIADGTRHPVIQYMRRGTSAPDQSTQ